MSAQEIIITVDLNAVLAAYLLVHKVVWFGACLTVGIWWARKG